MNLGPGTMTGEASAQHETLTEIRDHPGQWSRRMRGSWRVHALPNERGGGTHVPGKSASSPVKSYMTAAASAADCAAAAAFLATLSVLCGVRS